MTVQIGQIYRDTYFDGLNEGKLAHRTIRILAIDGEKATAETVTDIRGTVLDKPRKTRVSFKTLRSGYVLVPGSGT